MIEINYAQSGEALEDMIALSHEYVVWMLDEIKQQYPELNIQEFTSGHQYDDIRKKFPGEHVPPDGCLLIAMKGEEVTGCIALARLSEKVCEMRTLFVRPEFRGDGVGKKLVEACIVEAKKFDYEIIRLDTLAFMSSALKLYRAFGFYSIEPYLDVSENLKQYIRYLELDLRE